MDGLINIDKPPGISSACAVAVIKRLLGGGKVGHAGTLDPFATGVLVILVGKATRACEQVMSWPKTYETTVKLGATTATDDLESPEQPVPVVQLAHPPDRQEIERALENLTGTIEQRPPVYSAIKIRGKRACDRAREGDRVELHPRTVHVESITVTGYDWPLLHLKIVCGRGTYIRSIARDLGEQLGTGGYLTALRRTRIGPFGVEQAVRLDRLDRQNLPAHLKPVDSP